jgi:hypothetical protein
LAGKQIRKKPLRKERRRKKENIKMHFKETRREGVDCIHLGQDRD